jgi:hypothetical protein
MPKAPRDQESTTPKKRNRKAAPATGNGNGVHAENGNGAFAKSPEPIVAKPVTSSVTAVPVIAVGSGVEERIRERAYELYMQRGGNGGSPEHDWLRAKEEICGQ